MRGGIRQGYGSRHIKVAGGRRLARACARWRVRRASDDDWPADHERSADQPLPTGGIFFIPFNDIGVTDPGIGLRFNVAIPRPGFFETNYPVPLAGTGVTGYADWDVRIEFAAPPP